jgi:serine/threonine-protein kinase
VEKQIGPYNIVRLIGTGGMGSVYEAVHAQIQRRVAIKVLHKDFQQDPEFVQRFFNEARAVNIINHPNVVSISDFGTSANGSPYIVMEYLEGDSLRQRLARSGRLSPEVAMRIGKQVALGLAAAHGKQVIHRDLKPVNILLVPEAEGSDSERAKILDFGIAKLAADSGSKALTRVGVSLGTPAYMSPEQCKSARDVSDRSDVYSLGLILFEVLSGEHPFSEARSDAALMASHISAEPPSLDSKVSGCPGDLSALVRRMLAKQPEVRPSAGEVAAILGRLSGSTTGLLSQISLPGAVPPAAPSSLPAPAVGGAPATPLAQFLSGKGLYVGAGAALLFALLGLILVLRLLLDGGGDATQPARWQIRSEPSEAEVVDATGQVLGKTPFAYSHGRGPQIEVLSIRKDGFVEQRAPIDCSRDGEVSVALKAVSTATAAIGGQTAEKDSASSKPTPANEGSSSVGKASKKPDKNRGDKKKKSRKKRHK